MRKLFDLGKIVATPGAIELLETNNVNGSELLLKHLTGDFGKHRGHYDDIVLSDEELKEGAFTTNHDGKLNKWGIDTGEGRVMSSYEINEEMIWIITEWDRSVTTLLLPSEY